MENSCKINLIYLKLIFIQTFQNHANVVVLFIVLDLPQIKETTTIAMISFEKLQLIIIKVKLSKLEE